MVPNRFWHSRSLEGVGNSKPVQPRRNRFTARPDGMILFCTMSISFSSILATATDPLFLAGVVTVAGIFGAHYWRGRSALAHFLIQLLAFVILTGLLLAGGAVPYRPGVVAIGTEPKRFFLGTLEVIWWLGAAWL